MNLKDKVYRNILNNNTFRNILNKLSLLFQKGSSKKKIYRYEASLNELFLLYSIKKDPIALDIGSGPNPKNPFNAEKVFGADLRENVNNNVVFADLSLGRLPFDDNSFDYLTAFDVLEHIPRVLFLDGKTVFPLISLMNQIFRVLKPGGVFFSVQPVYPSKSAFQDPTHVNIMSEDTLDFYFCSKAWARIYGYEGSFELINDGWYGEKYFCFMKKTADRAERNLDFIQK